MPGLIGYNSEVLPLRVRSQHSMNSQSAEPAITRGWKHLRTYSTARMAKTGDSKCDTFSVIFMDKYIISVIEIVFVLQVISVLNQ